MKVLRIIMGSIVALVGLCMIALSIYFLFEDEEALFVLGFFYLAVLCSVLVAAIGILEVVNAIRRKKQ